MPSSRVVSSFLASPVGGLVSLPPMHLSRLLLCVALVYLARVSAEETNDLIAEAAAPPTPLDQEPNDYPAHLLSAAAGDVASGVTAEELQAESPIMLEQADA